jgi:hypothetical protein
MKSATAIRSSRDDRLDLAAGVGFVCHAHGFWHQGQRVVDDKWDANFTGSLLEFRSAVEYNPWHMWASDWGLTPFLPNWRQRVRDWPGIDFKGNVDFNYAGLQLYL